MLLFVRKQSELYRNSIICVLAQRDLKFLNDVQNEDILKTKFKKIKTNIID